MKNVKKSIMDMQDEPRQILAHSKLSEFLNPTHDKKTYHLLTALALGLTYVFTYLGSMYQNSIIYWTAFAAFIALSFPPFLLWNNYGLESLSKLGLWFTLVSVVFEAVWLYVLACGISTLFNKRK
jgi:hypothetical protein